MPWILQEPLNDYFFIEWVMTTIREVLRKRRGCPTLPLLKLGPNEEVTPPTTRLCGVGKIPSKGNCFPAFPPRGCPVSQLL